jgi:hypothetical protein
MTGVKAPLSCDMKLDWEKEKAFCLGATGGWIFDRISCSSVDDSINREGV